MKTLLSLTLSLSGLAFAQDQNPTEATPATVAPTEAGSEAKKIPPPADNSGKSVERIQVTGSHIKKLESETSSPITTIDADAIKQSGDVSVGDLLRKETSNSFGSRRENSGGNASGAAYVNLRGIGDARTLVLLNGKRISRDIQNGAVDLNMLPLAAIERIDILRDGASAIYGSDALGGVVNIITKKSFEGSQYAARAVTPELAGGASRTFSYTGGGSSDRTSFLNMLSYTESDALNSNQRDFLHPNWQAAGAPGTFRGTTTRRYIVDPTCPADRVNQRGTSCSYDVAEDSIRKPEVKQLSLFSSFDHQVTDDITLFTQFFATRKQVEWYWSPTTDERNIIIPAASRPILEAGAGRPVFADVPAGEDIELQYRLEELGREEKRIEATSFGINSGIQGKLGEAWNWEVSGATDRKFEIELGSGVALRDELTEAVASGAYNPFKPEGERGSVEDFSYTPWVRKLSLTRSFDVNLSGPIASLPAGDLSLAIGAEKRYEEYSEKVDSETGRGNTWGTLKGNSGAGDRSVESGYLELSIPAAKGLEFNLSGRYDHYSDFGNAFSPKIAASYRPFDWLFTRASYGTGFKAPTLFEMYRTENLQYVSNIRDYRYCNANGIARCPTNTGYIYQSGNTDLTEETSKSYNFGLGVEPIENLTVNVDYWNIQIDDEIGYIDTDALLRADAAGVDISSFGARVDRVSPDGEISRISTVYQNLGKAELTGLDSSIDYRIKTAAGTFGTKTAHSVQLKNKETDYPGAALSNELGSFGKPAWRNKTTLSYGLGKFYNAFTGDTVGPQKNNGSNIGSYWELDYFAKYSTPWSGEINMGVSNILNHHIPTTNAFLYSFLGRSYSVGYIQNF